MLRLDTELSKNDKGLWDLGKIGLMIIRTICIVVLTFTTIAPSIASGNSDGQNYKINLHSGKDGRSITNARGMILPVTGFNSGGNNQMNFEESTHLLAQFPIDLEKMYKLIIYIEYKENSDKYLFIEEMEHIGENLIKNVTDFILPAEVDMKSLEIIKGEENEDFKINDIEVFSDDPNYQTGSFRTQVEPDFIVSGNDFLKAQIVLEGEINGKAHYLIGELSVNKNLVLDSLLTNIAEVSIKNVNSDQVFISSIDNVSSFSVNNPIDKKFMMTKGNYNFNAKNELEWSGEVEIIDENHTINIPSKPMDLIFSQFDLPQSMYDNNFLSLISNLKLVTDNFEVRSPNITGSVEYKLSYEGNLVAEWTGGDTAGYHLINKNFFKTGTYQLEAILQFDSRSFNAIETFHYEESGQKVKAPVESSPPVKPKYNKCNLDEIYEESQEATIFLDAVLGESNKSLCAKISTNLTKQIIGSEEPLVITAGDTFIKLTTITLKELAGNDGDSIKISIDVVDSKDVPLNENMLSELYDFNVFVINGEKEQLISTFTNPITITTKIGEVKDKRKVAAYYLNEKTNTWEYVGGKVDGQQFTFTVNHFSKYAVMENDKTFKDIHSSRALWAKEYIEVLASNSIIHGKTADTFAPNDQITRAQFAILLARALNLPKQSFEGTFSDVSEKMDWAVYEIEAANRAGIVTGSNGKFRPYEPITRQQMAAMIIRAIEYKDASILEDVKTTVPFADVELIHGYAKEYVGQAAELGIINGRESGNTRVFAPKENATRAHAAKVLYEALELF